MAGTDDLEVADVNDGLGLEVVVTGRDEDGGARLAAVLDIDLRLSLLDLGDDSIDDGADIRKDIQLMLGGPDGYIVEVVTVHNAFP